MLLTRSLAMEPTASSSSARRTSCSNASSSSRRTLPTSSMEARRCRGRQTPPPTARASCSTVFFSGSYSDASRLDVAALSTSYSSRRATPASYPATTPRRKAVTMGNKGATGPFAPLVVAIRNVYGTKNFNLLRGKAISLHSQVIKEFGKSIGVDTKQVQGLIRLAKKNGEKLGFLA